MNNLQKNILDKIKIGEIDMKPRWHFVLRSGFLLSGVILVSLLTVYLVSFVMFLMRQSGIVFAPEFGLAGIVFLVVTSPWLLIGVSATFLAILFFLVKKYSFSFKRPLLYSMLGVVVISLLGSWLIQQTSMHQRMGEFVNRHEVPLFAPLYRGAAHEKPEGIVSGTISELTEDGFFIATNTGEQVRVITTTKTRMKPGTSLEAGEQVMVFGDKKGNILTAFGVRLHSEDVPRGPRGGEVRGVHSGVFDREYPNQSIGKNAKY